MELHVTRWQNDPPSEMELTERMLSEGLEAYAWSNSPGDRYSAHRHGYDKVIYVVSGSIEFGLPDLEKSVYLKGGDRIDLPAGVLHDAVVGNEGVHCLEARRHTARDS